MSPNYTLNSVKINVWKFNFGFPAIPAKSVNTELKKIEAALCRHSEISRTCAKETKQATHNDFGAVQKKVCISCRA